MKSHDGLTGQQALGAGENPDVGPSQVPIEIDPFYCYQTGTKGIKTWNFTKIVFETVPIPCIELPLVNDAGFIPESWSCGAFLLVLELRMTLNFLVLTQVWW